MLAQMIRAESKQLLLMPPTDATRPDPTAGRLRDRVSLEVAPLKDATQVIVENHYLHRGRTMAQIAYSIRDRTFVPEH